jgi:hypothetical protein
MLAIKRARQYERQSAHEDPKPITSFYCGFKQGFETARLEIKSDIEKEKVPFYGKSTKAILIWVLERTGLSSEVKP